MSKRQLEFIKRQRLRQWSLRLVEVEGTHGSITHIPSDKPVIQNCTGYSNMIDCVITNVIRFELIRANALAWFRVQLQGGLLRGRECVHHKLVGCHDDGCVGDLADELRAQAAVQARAPLLLGHQQQRLEERVVARALLPHARPGHLCRNRIFLVVK